MNKCIEYERKFTLTFQQFNTYMEFFAQRATPDIINQINYYYDDSSFIVHSRGETLRVRQTGEKLVMEHKYDKSRSGDMSISKEAATPISQLPVSIKIDGLKTNLIGTLMTNRCDFEINDIKLSLDRSFYLGTVDYELEIETQGDIVLPDFMQELVNGNAVSPMGKFCRFVSRLRQMDEIYEI